MGGVVRLLALVQVFVWLGGCKDFPFARSSPVETGAAVWKESVDVSGLIDVYQLRSAVRSMSNEELSREIEKITSVTVEERSVAQHVQLALLLDSVESPFAQIDQALQSLQRARELVPDQPLVLASLDELSTQIRRSGENQLTVERLKRENSELRKKNRRLRRQLASDSQSRAAAETVAGTGDLQNRESAAATNPEAVAGQSAPQGDQHTAGASAADGPGVAEELIRVKTLLRAARSDRRKQGVKITELQTNIVTLEEKIKALSEIERSLNQREDQLNSDNQEKTPAEQTDGVASELETEGGVQLGPFQ